MPIDTTLKRATTGTVDDAVTKIEPNSTCWAEPVVAVVVVVR